MATSSASPAAFVDPARQHGKGLALSAAGMVVISPDGLLIRLVQDAGTWDILFFRSLFIGLSLSLAVLVLHRVAPWTAWRRMGRSGALSTVLLAGANICFVASITQTTVANTLVLLATMPLFSAVIGWLVLRERVRPRTALAIALGFAGVVVIMSGSLGGGTLTGDAFGVGAAAFHGANLVVLRRAQGPVMLPALALSGFLAAILVLPWAQPLAVTGHDLAVLSVSGLIQMPLALALFLSGTRYVMAAEVALMSLIETMLGPLWAWIGVGEVPGATAILGGAVVLVAIALNSVLALRERRAARCRPAVRPEDPPGNA